MVERVDLRTLQIPPMSADHARGVVRDWNNGRGVSYLMRKYNLRAAFQVPALIEAAHRTLGTPLRKCKNPECGIYEFRLPDGPQECPECGHETDAVAL